MKNTTAEKIIFASVLCLVITSIIEIHARSTALTTTHASVEHGPRRRRKFAKPAAYLSNKRLC